MSQVTPEQWMDIIKVTLGVAWWLVPIIVGSIILGNKLNW